MTSISNHDTIIFMVNKQVNQILQGKDIVGNYNGFVLKILVTVGRDLVLPEDRQVFTKRKERGVVG